MTVGLCVCYFSSLKCQTGLLSALKRQKLKQTSKYYINLLKNITGLHSKKNKKTFNAPAVIKCN